MHQHVKTAYDGQPSCHVIHGHNGSHGESVPGHAHDGLAAWEPRSENATAKLHIAAPALLAALKALDEAVRIQSIEAHITSSIAEAWQQARKAIQQAEGA